MKTITEWVSGPARTWHHQLTPQESPLDAPVMQDMIARLRLEYPAPAPFTLYAHHLVAARVQRIATAAGVPGEVIAVTSDYLPGMYYFRVEAARTPGEPGEVTSDLRITNC